MNFTTYTTLPIEKVGEDLGVDLKLGLSQQEVHERSRRHELNEITRHSVYWWEILARQFQSSFVYLLLAAAILSFLLGEIVDGSLILFFVVIATALSFYQEYHSERILSLLKKYLVLKTKVRRNGKEELIHNRDLVPGDLILVEAGDIIPADIRFVNEHDITIDESALSGESAPVKKTTTMLTDAASQVYQALNIGFSGTTVTSGVGEAVVFATGRNTVMGGISQLAAETVRESTFEKGIKKLSTFILRLVLITLVVVFVANFLIKGANTNVIELFIFAIALAVSVIPEGLPVVTTFSLSRGALRLARNKVVVKRLAAVEDLGSIEVLCSDKTGTLTENKLKVVNIFADNQQEAMCFASLTMHDVRLQTKQSSSFDEALLARLTSQEHEEVSKYEKVSQIPFDPNRKRASALVRKEKKSFLIVRGAPEAVLPYCSLEEKEEELLQKWIEKEGKEGKRVIAVGKRDDILDPRYTVSEEEKKIALVGCISFADPIKKTTQSALKKAESLGVAIKIVTGDSKEVAGAVAKELGIIKEVDEVITGKEFDSYSPQKQEKIVNDYHVFARVSPQQKYTIIQRLQEKREVGFLGEGINDAPALKIANVAVVVQNASNIAQEAADIILLEKSLEVIIDGIREGRDTFANTLKYIKATLASNFGNFYAVAVASLLIKELPMLPIQILLLNLLSDFPMIAVATDNIDAREVRKPREYNIREIALFASLFGIVSTVFDFVFFGLFYKLAPSVLQTNWFVGSVLTELLFLFSIRTRMVFFKARRPSFILFFLSSIAFAVTIVIPYSVFGQEVFKFRAPSFEHMSLILGIVVVYFVATESFKKLYYRFISEKDSSRLP